MSIEDRNYGQKQYRIECKNKMFRAGKNSGTDCRRNRYYKGLR